MKGIKKIRMSACDKEWSKLVRERDKRCLSCGKRDNLAAHHYLRRSVKSTRLLLENGVTLCPSCHIFNHQFSAHKTPEAFKRWFKKNYPDRDKLVSVRAKTHMTERQAILEFKVLNKNI